MIYREFKDKKLSMLGFGAMRLPQNIDIPSELSKMDEEIKKNPGWASISVQRNAEMEEQFASDEWK